MSSEHAEEGSVVVTKVGQSSESSLQHLGYWVRGSLAKAPKINEPLVVAREERNGVKAPGLFTTSLILNIVYLSSWRYLIQTENSTWMVEELS